jgi:hypothetical protein
MMVALAGIVRGDELAQSPTVAWLTSTASATARRKSC